ncbi:MAG: transporter substrate-binding domain-containing protein, partial [Bacteroidota bacterium]
MKPLRRSVWRVTIISTSVLALVAFMFVILRDKEEVQEELFSRKGLPKLVSLDLKEIKARGKLILLTENSSSTYYTIQDESLGFDYELAKSFADYLNVSLEVRVIQDVDSMFAMLYRGEGDIIGNNLTVTKERSEFLAFSPALYQTDQVLVQRIDTANKNLRDGILMHDSLELDKIPIHVHKYSSFYNQLGEIKKRSGLPIKIIEVNGIIGSEELIQQVALGAIPSTITDRSLANMLRADYPNLDMNIPVSTLHNVAWAFRPNAYQLSKAFESFLGKEKTREQLVKLNESYVEHYEEPAVAQFKTNFKMPPLSPGAISPFDSLYKKYCSIPGWDWRLLTALSYVESSFNPNAVSYAGARGLMQLMPASLKKYGCDSTSGPEDNVRAGATLIR